MSKNVKDSPVLLEHSEAKVKLLGEYLNRYLNIISNDGRTKGIYLYDLFCGEGAYDNGGEGSPIITLKAVKELHYINKAKNNRIPPVNIYFNDKDKSKVVKLKQVIQDKHLYYPEFGSLTFDTSDYKELLPSVLEKCSSLNNEKAFIFIDPYGYKHIRASDIKRLMSSKNAEVLLFLPTQFMYRFDENGTPISLIDILDEISGYENWNTSSAHDFVTNFTEGLRSYMGEQYFVDTFFIQKDRNTLFCLFFFTSHIKGFEKMLESKWKLDEDRGEGFRYNAEKLSLFGMNGATHPLEAKIIQFIKQEKKYNSDVYEFVLRNGYLPKHGNEVLGSLQERGILQVKSTLVDKVRKGAFYINYKSYKTEPQRVSFLI